MGKFTGESSVLRAKLARLRAWYADLCRKLPEAPLVQRAYIRRQIDQLELEEKVVH